ncbi:hypothetical protein GOZ78_07290 [Agrobacterium vitis]|uniref:Uncharacterized protein n=2 Tax=Agrobacterium vitis TaxID=373 RepID=A0ABD6GGT1_AGRVI|nr:hypothetical protein [Agrobacterium vitis]MUP07163.1 hypothetical protein [Agrobacterium vitis]MUZ82104.1 hypothetical protein [Agrobacterium vitis]MVA09836.1 hypothetical protein [Agrobacterium vitis]MVA90401.1 hypothetical protein [Agrobacterium vitis]
MTKTYQTYTKTNPETNKVYSGRTSGAGTPAENIGKRDANHHMNTEGYAPARLDKSSPNKDAIRGREQQLIEENGVTQSIRGTSGNKINGISDKTHVKEIIRMQNERNFPMNNRRKPKAGSILEIKIDENLSFLCQILRNNQIAVYNHDVDRDSIVKNNIDTDDCIFIVSVMDRSIKSDRWPIIGHSNIPSRLDRPFFYFIKDIITGAFSIYNSSNGAISPATYDDIRGLEAAAVWDANHIEDRIRDHSRGVPNKWEISLSPDKK